MTNKTKELEQKIELLTDIVAEHDVYYQEQLMETKHGPKRKVVDLGRRSASVKRNGSGPVRQTTKN